MKFYPAALSLLLASPAAHAIDIDWTSNDAIKAAMKPIAKGMTDWYHGYRVGDVPGNLPDPYHWWQCGAMFGALIDYWHYTGDDQYNEWVQQGMIHQIGDNADYMPANQSKSLGNDDQGFWGMAAMSAAESKFPDPPEGQPGWLALAQAVYTTQYLRWDTSTCGGGLRWQIYSFNAGYTYKNTITQGCFFNVASRLARYTGNQTYAEQAEKAWNWIQNLGLVNAEYHFYDGSDSTINCTKFDRTQWTYNAGIFLHGAATMWNVTAEADGNEDNIWKERVTGIIGGLSVFFASDSKIMVETACETGNTCNIDQRTFKAYLARWMAAAIKVAPWSADLMAPYLEASREAAALACNDKGDGTAECSLRWTMSGFDGSSSVGLGENMAALEMIGTALVDEVAGPVTNSTGGTSQGDPDAGLASPFTPTEDVEPVDTADRVGAAIITIFLMGGMLGGAYWMMASEM
ncbi:Mannan endo-alpha-mannosidase dcw1 [Lasiodiplodia theobromae]|uniref:Mannan endo-alpha-mannosidase dcw1 n=1 Tax=Lasiodiplodia theobromae TaxID=45133 RepID=UPI0015C3214D|nr:Mannan endo-alpha-mannosidase dcw1 [Lasiodiplodia theobromae]KAF4546297.1 Mannan endo-alpha-mannosidase dcw1 [Lasiodiplodia theobromae]